MAKKRYRLKKTVIAKFIIFLCLIGVFFSVASIIKYYKNTLESSQLKEELDNNIKVEINKETNEEVYNINFEEIKQKNSDSIAYLNVKGTNISYIVVKASDNDFYLNRNFDKKNNLTGWIFADYHNKFDETDKNIVIYGHNTRDGSMFGTLKRILNKEWYSNQDNYIIALVTDKGTYQYKVFSTYTIVPEDYYINTVFNDNEFSSFIKELKRRSFFNYGVDITKEDKILTLSSCIGDGKKRVVLHAKLLDKIN